MWAQIPFIKFTEYYSGKPLSIRVDYVISFVELGDGKATVTMQDGNEFAVNETHEYFINNMKERILANMISDQLSKEG